ncbi:hypothetical protein CEXT_95041 [Caerostris extrusa]|uniref:Uncharacterized protein n=1 Tax=Caerostris extrusa TaxID=172846 RepID=A0AAV4PB50_CAEEX|nr:hypothetical protein CEXT_95041 [Caerostris extrusa]
MSEIRNHGNEHEGSRMSLPSFISGLSLATTVDDGPAIEMEFRRLEAFQPRKRLDGFFIVLGFKLEAFASDSNK